MITRAGALRVLIAFQAAFLLLTVAGWRPGSTWLKHDQDAAPARSWHDIAQQTLTPGGPHRLQQEQLQEQQEREQDAAWQRHTQAEEPLQLHAAALNDLQAAAKVQSGAAGAGSAQPGDVTDANGLQLPVSGQRELPSELDCAPPRADNPPWGRLCKVQGLVYTRTPPPQLVYLLNATDHPNNIVAFFPTNGDVQVAQPLSTYWHLFRFAVVPIADIDAQYLCKDAAVFNEPVIFLTRDHANIFHFFWAETMPLFLALQAYGLQNLPKVQLVVLDDEMHPAKGSKGDIFLGEFERLTGRPPLALAELPDRFCAATAVIGVNLDMFHYTYNEPWSDPVFKEALGPARQRMQEYKDWLLGRYGLVQELAGNWATRNLSARPLTLTFSLRNGVTHRRVNNMDMFLHIANSKAQRYHVQLVDFGALPLREQISTAMGTDVFVSGHGAALTHLMFLPPWGVSVELMPYRFGPGTLWPELNFYHGYSNWALIARRSHVLWHNRNRFETYQAEGHAIDEWKYHNTKLLDEDMHFILDSASRVLQTPLEERDLDRINILNDPVGLNDPPVPCEPHWTRC